MCFFCLFFLINSCCFNCRRFKYEQLLLIKGVNSSCFKEYFFNFVFRPFLRLYICVDDTGDIGPSHAL